MTRTRVVVLAILAGVLAGAGIATAAQDRTVVSAAGVNLIKLAKGMGGEGVADGTWKPAPGVGVTIQVPSGQQALLLADVHGDPNLRPTTASSPYQVFYGGLDTDWTWSTGVNLGETWLGYGPVPAGTYTLRAMVRWVPATNEAMDDYGYTNYCGSYPADCAPTMPYTGTGPWQIRVERAPVG